MTTSGLPVLSYREEIIDTVRRNRVTVIVGETGSGKTTQIPAMLLQELDPLGRIAVTEPRRFAATSVASFVSTDIFNEEVGGVCGYKVRNDEASCDDTKILYLTEGMLLQMLKHDPLLRQYQIIMVDEVHERSANVDLILGVLKDLLTKRLELKVVVASATVDSEMFSEYFGGCPIVKIPGRMFPVDVEYHDLGYDVMRHLPDFLADTVLTETSGDVLVFFSGQDEIGTIREALEAKKLEGVKILDLHGAQAPDEQRLVYKVYPGCQKLILATNIAETSITIDGVTAVVDTGRIKQSDIDHYTHTATLRVVNHSQSGCKQRAGRAGRTAPGVCYRVFSEESFIARPTFTKPEIQRMSLESAVLLMFSLNLPVHTFDFITKPQEGQIDKAISMLKSLGALTTDEKVTALGKEILHLPLDVQLAKFVLESRKHGCVHQAVICAAFLSVQSPLIVSRKDEEKARAAKLAHSKFGDNSEKGMSDLVRYLRIWEMYSDAEKRNGWCHENFLHTRRMKEIHDIANQLIDVLERMDVDVSVGESNVLVNKVFALCFSDSLAYTASTRDSRGTYTGLVRKDLEYKAFPGSVMFYGQDQYMVATQIVSTQQVWARVCVPVDKAWLSEICPSLFTTTRPVLSGRGPRHGEYEIRYSVMIGDHVIEEVRQICNEETAQSVQQEWEKEVSVFKSCVYRDGPFGYMTEDGSRISYFNMTSFNFLPGDKFILSVEGVMGLVPKCLALFSSSDFTSGRRISEESLNKLREKFARG